MASFQIYQDVEKENPQNLIGGVAGVPTGILKERKGVAGATGIYGKQAAVINGAPHHIQTRSNFVNANVGKGLGATRAVPSAGGNKLVLRQVGNTTKNSNVNSAKIVGQKKSTVVPVVEQFKSFSVYEDKSQDQVDRAAIKSSSHQEQQIAIATQKGKDSKTITISKSTTTTTCTTVGGGIATSSSSAAAAVAATTITTTTSGNLKSINDENIFGENTELNLDRHHIKNDSLHKDFGGIIDEETVFNTTPMSVSDVLSPMSIDRSNITSFDSVDKENRPDLLEHLQRQQEQLLDDSNLRNADENQKQQQHQQHQLQQQKEHQVLQQIHDRSMPRNDRQRFFEVVEYQDAILEYFRESERKHRPKPHYMRRQQDINYSMRTILVDWLVEVSEEYSLDTETLYLSISYIDRFLSHMSVVRSKLQLVGTAAMYIAAKYEEIYPPDVGEFVFITDDTYTKPQVLRMEQLILKILAFDLCTPTPYVFVNTYAVLTDMPNELKFLTMYICELSLLEAEPYLRFLPSLISAASHALARYILDYTIWTEHLEEVTKYRLEDLKEVFLHLCKTHKAATTLSQQAIQEKYKSKKFNEVSTLNPVELTPEMYDEITFKYNESAAAEKANQQNQQQAMLTANNENVRRMISLMFN